MSCERIAIIGLGKVGSTFAAALGAAGCEVFTISGHEELERGESEEITRKAEVLLITTPDKQIEKVAKFIADKKGFREGQSVIHMSGAYSSDLLLAAKSQGAKVCSLHPLQSFADRKTALKNLSETVFTVEGDVEAVTSAKNLVKLLGAKVFEINKETKPIYHAAACIASNYLVTIIRNSLALLEVSGIPKSEGWKALAPLVKGAVDNIDNLGVTSALTGPIVRGDTNTVEQHLEKISLHKSEAMKLYCCLGEYTVDVAIEKGDLDRDIAKKIKQILRGENCGSEKNNN